MSFDTLLYESYHYKLINLSKDCFIVVTSYSIKKHKFLVDLFTKYSDKIYIDCKDFNVIPFRLRDVDKNSINFILDALSDKHTTWNDDLNGDISKFIVDNNMKHLFKYVNISELEYKYILRLLDNDKIRLVGHGFFGLNTGKMLFDDGHIEFLLTATHIENYIAKRLDINAIIYLLNFAAEHEIKIRKAFLKIVRRKFADKKCVSICLAKNSIFCRNQFIDYDVINVYAINDECPFRSSRDEASFFMAVKHYKDYNQSIRRLYNRILLEQQDTSAEYIIPKNKNDLESMILLNIRMRRFDHVEKLLDYAKNFTKKFRMICPLVHINEDVTDKYPYLAWMLYEMNAISHKVYQNINAYKYDVFDYDGCNFIMMKNIFYKFGEFPPHPDMCAIYGKEPNEFFRKILKQDNQNIKKIRELIFDNIYKNEFCTEYNDIITGIATLKWNMDTDVKFYFL